MRVKILQSRVGASEAFNAGYEYDLPDGRAARWIAGGFATPVGERQPAANDNAETAVASPVVEHSARTSRKRK